MQKRTVLLLCIGLVARQAFPQSNLLEGFSSDSIFDEQTRTFTFVPDVRLHLNAPQPLLPNMLTHIIFYALPNGNSIEQTIGRKPAEAVDWHYTIQHIGAQMRQLRETIHDEQLIIAYLEADNKSWPQWRKKHTNSNEVIVRLVDSVRSIFKRFTPSVTLSGHSGGGSFVFGFVNALDRIPDFVNRISFLDSNYGYDDKEHHGEKLISWLRAGDDHVLSVIAYDDRFITLNGKRVVTDSGGTFRATGRMIAGLQKEFRLNVERDSVFASYVGFGGRIDVRVHTNPDTLILHTVLVEKNGFIHGMTVATPHENRAGTFWGETEYTKWIAK